GTHARAARVLRGAQQGVEKAGTHRRGLQLRYERCGAHHVRSGLAPARERRAHDHAPAELRRREGRSVPHRPRKGGRRRQLRPGRWLRGRSAGSGARRTLRPGAGAVAGPMEAERVGNCRSVAGGHRAEEAAMPRSLVVLLTFVAAAGAAQAQCTGIHQVSWPAVNPVWTFCWIPPDASSGPDGSGIELRHVFYKGRRVFWKANMPVLNVQYDPGGCGTFRDWFNQLSVFDANNVVSPGYAEPTTTPKTTCDAPGTDPGTFRGVALQKLSDRVILTSVASAGWYRYIEKWTFHLDGTIEPRMGFSAVAAPCVNKAHTHHGYYRFDFDIDGFPNDMIQRRWFFFFWLTINPEATRNRETWRALDASGRGYDVVPGPNDGPAPDAWAGSDGWMLRYHFNEEDDGGATGGAMGNAQHITPFVNGESIDHQDVVLWYRVAVRHDMGLACSI